ISWQAKIFPFVEQDNLWKMADAGENDATYNIPNNRWYPWSTPGGLHNGLPENPAYILPLGTEQQVYSCPADSRTLTVSVTSQTGGFTIAFTAYYGNLGVNHKGGAGSSDPTYGSNPAACANTAAAGAVDPYTKLLTGMNGVLITKQNITGTPPPGVRIGDVTD